jgi:hypothetical protein
MGRDEQIAKRREDRRGDGAGYRRSASSGRRQSACGWRRYGGGYERGCGTNRSVCKRRRPRVLRHLFGWRRHKVPRDARISRGSRLSDVRAADGQRSRYPSRPAGGERRTDGSSKQGHCCIKSHVRFCKRSEETHPARNRSGPSRRPGPYMNSAGTGPNVKRRLWFCICYPAKRGSGNPRMSSPVTVKTLPRSTPSAGKRGRGGFAIEVT